MAFSERHAAENYTLGGARLWFDELIDTTNNYYAGMVDLGCIEEAPIAMNPTYQEHFCAHTGTRLKDRKIVKEVAMTITVTLVEVDPENMRLFFLGGDITRTSASVGGGSVTDEPMKLVGTDRRILRYGKNATSIVVTDTGGTPYTLTTDYVVEDYYGFKSIRRVSGGGIADGEVVLVDYSYDILENRSFNPFTNILKVGRAKFTGVSDTGQEMIADFDYVSITPTGDFSWNSDDWTTFQLEIEVLDNSVAAPSAPFGTVRHLGAGQNI